MIACQFALYPLRTERVGEVLDAALAEVSAMGIEVGVDRMSTEIRGDEARVFAALQAAFARAAQMGEVVMSVTLSNAC